MNYCGSLAHSLLNSVMIMIVDGRDLQSFQLLQMSQSSRGMY